MAGLIPQKFLDDLLDRVDIVETIDRRVKLKKTGKNYSARCPFHDEKTPSFSVNPDKQFYYCFGCGAGGNALGFVMDYENVDFPQAVEILAGTLGLEVPREPGRRDSANPGQDSGNREIYELLERVARYYQQQLRQHPQAQHAVNFLRERGLTGTIAKQFDLGFAPPGGDNLLKTLGTTDSQVELLHTAGMLVKNETGQIYDRFRNRVMYPIHDHRGRVIAFGGRVLGDTKPKYLNSPETPVFAKGQVLYGLHQARKANRSLARVLVVEGYMDVIALAQHGIDNATATLGTATSRTHLERLYRLCPEVVFCFDGDEAGRKAAFRALEAALPCMEDGRQARFLFLPEGEDPDSVVRTGGADHFHQLITQSKPLESFLFEWLESDLDSSALDGRARLSKLVLPYIRQIPEGVYRQLMFQALAERTGIELQRLMQLEAPPPARDASESAFAVRAERAERLQPRQRDPYDQAPDGHSNLAQAAIALLLHQPASARLVEPDALAELPGSDILLLRELLNLLHRRPESSTAMLLGHWYNTPEGELLNRLAGQERLIPAAGIEQQLADTIAALSQLPQRSRLRDQVDKLKLTSYADVSELEKQRLREMLQQKLQLDVERSRRKP